MSAVKAQGWLKQSIGWSSDRDVINSGPVTQRLRQQPFWSIQTGNSIMMALETYL